MPDGITRVDAKVRIPLSQVGRIVAAQQNETPQATLDRLAQHRSVLEMHGISDLSALGKYSLSGLLAPRPGVSVPPGSLAPAGSGGGAAVQFDSAFRIYADPAVQGGAAGPITPVEPSTPIAPIGRMRVPPRVVMPAGDPAPAPAATPSLARIGGSAIRMDVLPAPGTTGTNRMFMSIGTTFPLNTSYWAAQWIDIADDTTVVLQSPIRYLVIIAEQVTIGRNVTFTWDRPPLAAPSAPEKPAKPGAPPTATSIAKPPAAQAGTPGGPGGSGTNGGDAPEVEVWILSLTGRPAFDLKGQDGGAGGAGGAGGDGADGAAGSPDAKDFWGFCARGPGNGGDGGPGGAGGNGGPGGSGGHGGRLTLYAPRAVLDTYTQGFYVSVDGGAGGPGGIPGAPGSGGQGGPRGNNSNGCQPGGNEVRSAGSAGAQGAGGQQGTIGSPGATFGSDAVRFLAITEDNFRQALSRPAVETLGPTSARVGDTIAVNGRRFTRQDKVVLEGVECATTVASDTALSFVVPAVEGGVRALQVRQPDGTLSNRASLRVLPVLTPPAAGTRARPGDRVTLQGSGFGAGARVRVNGQEMPEVQVQGNRSLSFRLVRPTNVAPNPTGETVEVKVALSDGSESNGIPLVLETFQVLVIGDSVAWGQGLEEGHKYHGRVEQTVRSRNSGIGVYKTVAAHSGAVIGVGNGTVLPALNGEVPTSFPTLMQQAAALAATPGTEFADLVLVTGGINDVDVRNILNPTVTPAQITAMVEQQCHLGMRSLLVAMAGDATITPPVRGQFPTARIVVTGYYQIVSEQTDTLLLQAAMCAVGVAVAAIPGMLIGGVLSQLAKDAVIANARTFATQSALKLKLAVDEANAMLGGAPRIFFANPGFTPANSIHASDPLLFGIQADLSPQDAKEIATSRAAACILAGPTRTDVETCKRASVGHPNIRGAQMYADAITPLL